jgi:hypothetical protein
VIVTVTPPTLIVPVREVEPGFAATVNAGVAPPVPNILPELIVIQAACELALQLHAAPVVNVTV